MAARFDGLRVAAADPPRLARFWAAVLGRRATTTGDPVDVEPREAASVLLRFASEREPRRPGQGWLHLHLTSTPLEDQQAVVERCLDLGARHLDIGQTPEERHVVLADPEDNEFCVIEPGNRFLAGTGFLGEVTCEGTREVGLFWSAALDWPLVWDQDQETAVQSPAGGTKISWGGPPLDGDLDRTRLGFDLTTADDLDSEADRLVGLGARVLEHYDGVVVLADPDGQPFRLCAG